jgi:hypothetical protein
MGKSIVLEVCAGFSNRLRALVSGICYAEELNLPIRVHWSLHPTCGSLLHECIDILSLPTYVSITSLNTFYEPQMIHKQEDLESKPLRIKSYAHFYTSSPERFNYHLRNLRFKVESLVNRSYVGVHIRRTDHTKCIENSPVEFFIDSMNKEPTDTKFYLATDCLETKNKLKELFKERIITSSIVLKRTTREGVRGALQDFVSFSNCSKIIGTRYSSFSEMAALYGGIELVIKN